MFSDHQRLNLLQQQNHRTHPLSQQRYYSNKHQDNNGSQMIKNNAALITLVETSDKLMRGTVGNNHRIQDRPLQMFPCQLDPIRPTQDFFLNNVSEVTQTCSSYRSSQQGRKPSPRGCNVPVYAQSDVTRLTSQNHIPSLYGNSAPVERKPRRQSRIRSFVRRLTMGKATRWPLASPLYGPRSRGGRGGSVANEDTCGGLYGSLLDCSASCCSRLRINVSGQHFETRVWILNQVCTFLSIKQSVV